MSSNTLNKNACTQKQYTFECKIKRCNYSNPNNDYKVYVAEVDRNEHPEIKLHSVYKTVSLVGNLPNLILGTVYNITATEEINKYGTSYKVINVGRNTNISQEETYTFLKEILTNNQAKTLFENYPDIIQKVKNNDLSDIDLSKLKGIGEKTFKNIKTRIIENFCLFDFVAEFQGYLSLTVIKKIYEKYSSVELIRTKLENSPYECLCSLGGIGFKTADSLLLKIEEVSKSNIKNGKQPIINFTNDLKASPQRCLSCIFYLLQENENSGHTKMNLIELRKQCLTLAPECIDSFTDCIKSDLIYYNKDNLEIALQKTYDTEKYIADTISNNIVNNNQWYINAEDYRNLGEYPLTDEQVKSLENVAKYNVFILNGQGGTGKSFSIYSIIQMLKDNNKSFKLFAPTGKASKVMSAYTKETASTIHRGLGYMPPNNWTYNSENKLNVDIIIVDEFSMVDIYLFKRLIDAIDFTKTKLFLIGDSAQLPSVQCGNLLHDFLNSNVIPNITLTKIFRYGEGGLMKVATDVRNSKIYLNNSMKNKATTFGKNQDYMFIDLQTEQIPSQTIALYKKLIDKGYTPFDIQVLTAKKAGDCGVKNLNNLVQKVTNNNYGSKNCISYGETTYYENDTVVQIVNNYKAELVTENNIDLFNDNIDDISTVFIANGESGTITRIDKNYVIIDFDGTKVKYYKSDLATLDLGYAMTIHKSQGSSSKIVILLTPASHTFMENSNLIYVGLTRMKEKCFHLGTYKTVNIAINKKADLSRNTFMIDLLSK